MTRAPLPPERWAELQALFEQAVGLSAADREHFLDARAKETPELVADVRELLAAEGSGVTARLAAVDEVARELMASTEHTGEGQRLGPYRLEEEIGRGGMGVVYRASRVDDDFRQTVAVKILPGALYRPESRTRFRNERRILAELEHPSIARLLDGGTTEDGVPYVIMEYVDGLPVDAYADQLDLEGRVWLFLSVCDAVQYAHRRLVVHRDLKPSNILVTGDGVPKLLDFGIATLLDEDGTQGETGTRLMTPRYASPEQLRGERVGTATDIYSLGLVLYRLLTGHHARAGDAAAGAAAGSAALSREALEAEPPVPSVAAGDPRLRGDLDTIVRKALRPEPDERYDSVEALAEDLRRYLTGRPVSARPPSFEYRAGKFLRRNRATVTASAVAAVIVLTQTGLFMDRLARERDAARSEAARANETLDFITEVFRGADPFVSADPDLSAVQLLGQGTGRVERELADQPQVQAEILTTVGNAYENLGVYDSAVAVFRRGLDVRLATAGPDALETARSWSELGGVLVYQGDLDEADRALDQSLAIRRDHLPANHPDLAVDLGQQAFSAQRRGDLARADSLFGEALQILQDPAQPRDELHASLMANHGLLLIDRDQLGEAEERLQGALALRRDLFGDRHPEVAVVLGHLARLRERQGELAEADRLYSEMIPWAREMVGPDHPFVTTWYSGQSAVLRALGRNEEALTLQEEVLGRARAQDPGGREVAVALNNVANLYGNLGRLGEAEAALQEALRLNRSLYGDDHPSVATNLNNLATLVWRRGDFARAATLQEEVLAMDLAQLGPEHEYVATDRTALGRYRLYAGDLLGAETPLREGLELILELRGQDNLNAASAQAAWAEWLVAAGRAEEAVPLARQSLETRLLHLDGDAYDVALSRSAVGAALLALGRLEEAGEELREAARVLGDAPEGDPGRRRNEMRLRDWEARRSSS